MVSHLSMQGQIESFIECDKVHALLGDQIPIHFTIKMSEDEELAEIDLNAFNEILSPTGEPDSLGIMRYPKADISIIDFGKWQTGSIESFPINEADLSVQVLNDRKIIQNTIKVSIWETGKFEIPDIKYVISSGGNLESYSSGNRIELIISAPGKLEEMSPDSIDLAPIKDILKEPSLLSDYLPYVYTALSFILIGLLFFYLSRLRKEKPEAKEEEIIIRPAHEIALEKLKILEEKELWQNDRVKEYQSQLTYVIREYLENRYGISALEMTTDEIISQLKAKDFEMKWKDGLKRILQIADLVKFAKATPPLTINQEFMDEARDFVSNTKDEEIDHEILENLDNV